MLGGRWRLSGLLVCVGAVLVCNWPAAGLDIFLQVAKMAIFRQNAEMQCNGCMYFSYRLGNKGADIQNLGGFWGAVESAVTAMRRHPDNPRVQVLCGNSLEAVALFNRKQSIAVERAGGIHAVIDALRRFPDIKHVQMLTNVLSSFNDYVPENRPIILKAGGIDLIFKAMRKFYNDPEVLFRTGCAISATSGDPGVAAALAADGGVAFLMQMMRDHLKSMRVGQEIMQATRNMMHEGTQYREELLAHGFAENVLDTIKAEMHERGTPTIGSTNLAMLAFKNRTLQDRLLQLGAMEIVLDGMKTYSVLDTSGYGGVTTSDVWPTLPSCAQAIWCMVRDNADAQARLETAGGVDLLSKLMVHNPAYVQFLGYACAALGEVARGNETRVVELARAGVPDWCLPHLRWQVSLVDIPGLERMIGRF